MSVAAESVSNVPVVEPPSARTPSPVPQQQQIPITAPLNADVQQPAIPQQLTPEMQQGN